jgi:hypothetical protein
MGGFLTRGVLFGGERFVFFGLAASRLACSDGPVFAFFLLYPNVVAVAPSQRRFSGPLQRQHDLIKRGLITKFTFDPLSIENGYSLGHRRRCRSASAFRLWRQDLIHNFVRLTPSRKRELTVVVL